MEIQAHLHGHQIISSYFFLLNAVSKKTKKSIVMGLDILLPIFISVLYLINLFLFAQNIKLLHKLKKKLIMNMILKLEIYRLEVKRYQTVVLKY
jgi:hypothetical protein